MTNYNVDIPDHETDVARILPPSPFYNLLPSPSDLAVPAYQNAILATVQKIRLIMQSVPIVKYWHCVQVLISQHVARLKDRSWDKRKDISLH